MAKEPKKPFGVEEFENEWGSLSAGSTGDEEGEGADIVQETVAIPATEQNIPTVNSGTEQVDWEHKYKTLKGILEQANKGYADEIARLKESARSIGSQQNQVQQIADQNQDISADEQEKQEEMDYFDFAEQEYGTPFKNMIAGIAMKTSENTVNTILKDVIPKIMTQIGEGLKPVLGPIAMKQQQEAEEAHVNTIRKEHPDLDELDPDAIGKWIEDMRGIDPQLGNAYARIAEEGNSGQVAKMLTQFKLSTGLNSQQPQAPQAQAQQAPQAPNDMSVPPPQNPAVVKQLQETTAVTGKTPFTINTQGGMNAYAGMSDQDAFKLTFDNIASSLATPATPSQTGIA